MRTASEEVTKILDRPMLSAIQNKIKRTQVLHIRQNEFRYFVFAVTPTLLDFECYETGFIDEHCGVLTAVFCDLTIFKMKMSTSTLISFSSLFFCSDVTYFAEPQAFSKKGRILIQSSLQVESLDVLYLTNRFHMLPCIYYRTDARLHGIYQFYTWKNSLFLSNFATLSDTKIAL